MSVTISANVLVRNEIKHVDAFVCNMIDACMDEVVFLDGGSADGVKDTRKIIDNYLYDISLHSDSQR